MNGIRFFRPFVGSNYYKGIGGKKILVIGASFYCANTKCQFYHKCTDVSLKNSSSFDKKCPVYAPDDKQLSNEPTYCVEDLPQTYRKFGNALTELFKVDSSEDVWKNLAFTNYCQFFLPAENKFRPTFSGDLSDRDFSAFIETCHELEPDIVIVWGAIISQPLIHANPYIKDHKELDKTGGYICRMTHPSMQKSIALVNCHHPSSTAWWGGIEDFTTYLKNVLLG